MTTKIAIADILTDGMQTRECTHPEIVQEYAEIAEGGSAFPPVEVYSDGSGWYWLVDGFHRLEAAKRLNKKYIRAQVTQGTKSEALWAACAANSGHGLRRSNADKRKALSMACRLHPELSHEEVARHCGVTRRFVIKFRSEAEASMPPLPHRRETVAGGEQFTTSRAAGGEPFTTCGGGNGAAGGEPFTTSRAAGGEQFTTSRAAGGEQFTTSDAPQAVIGPLNRAFPPTRTGIDGKRYPMRPKPVPEAPRDGNGSPIPSDAMEAWGRRNEVKALASSASAIRVAVRKAQEEKNPAFAGIGISALLTHLDAAFDILAGGVPFAVCPFCQGLSRECTACKGSGLLTRFQYDTIVPKELKGDGGRGE